MGSYMTPPHTGLMTPRLKTPHSTSSDVELATPISLKWESPKSKTPVRDTYAPLGLTQTAFDANLQEKRLQQDLLIITGFNDNTTLHWRPTWFNQSLRMWTLHNPPNVITERLPHDYKGVEVFTRRMRQTNDPPPQYIKSWDHWKHYCDLYSVPYNFLCEEQVRLLRMGLPRSSDGSLCIPPRYPLYPEPLGQGPYALTPSVYSTYLPPKFRHVTSASPDVDQEKTELVVVNPNGALTVESCKNYSQHRNPGKGQRWSYLPWTIEMEESCRPLTVRLRLWNDAREGKGLEKKT